jgi:hypothetical protein
VFQRLRSTDAILVVSALLIAYFIWLIAKTGTVEEQVVDDVPIVLDLPPYVQGDPSRKTANIEVRYPKSIRKDIHSRSFTLRINEPELFSQAGVSEAKSVTVPLLADDVQHPSLPPSVQVQRVEPGRMTVMLKFRTAPARIVPRTVGEPSNGYHLEKTIVSPPERLLTGPQDQLDRLPRNRFAVVELQTNPIFLTGQRDSFSTSVAILVPERLNLVDEDTRQRLPRDVSFALVQVVIKEQNTSRTIEAIPIQVATVSRNLAARTEPTSAAVVILGPRTRVESLDPRVILLWLKNPPEEKVGFVGKIAIEARMDETVSPDVSILAVRPDVVVLRYETLPSETPTTATVAP